MHLGHYRRNTRRQEGTRRLHRRRRESAESWRELLLDLRRRGLSTAPELAVADGALGFCKALGEVWPTTREQRCYGAQKSWRRFDGHNQLPKVIQGVKFTDGIEVIGNIAEPQAQAAA